MIYTVKRGDTLYDIATQFGTSAEALARVNNISNPNNLSVGRNLFIPLERITTYTVKSSVGTVSAVNVRLSAACPVQRIPAS